MDLAPRYRVIRTLARGGMANLELATARSPTGCERLVVLKRLAPHLRSDRDSRRLFALEARLAFALEHPNLARVYDVLGEPDRPECIVFEFLHGVPLITAIRRALTRDPDSLLLWAPHIGIEVCAGLHHAHELTDSEGRFLGVVHRDLTPHNVMLTFDGQVKLIDFGIARASRKDATREGIIRGKSSYMSPEQCRAERLDRRSDLFSLSVVLWEITTGRRLFPADNDLDAMRLVERLAIPPPTTLVPEYPLALEDIIMRGLRRHREERWSTALEIGERLAEVAAQRKMPRSPAAMSLWLANLFPDQRERTTLAESDATTPAISDPTPREKKRISTLKRKVRRRRRLRRLSVSVATMMALLLALIALGASLHANQRARPLDSTNAASSGHSFER